MTPASSSPTPQTHALSFGQAADLYDAVRPTYPAEALSWAFGDSPLDVVDLGAGTGLLTRGLVAAGHRVTSIEPDAKMLDKLRDTTTGLVGSQVGSAEEIPLPDGCADAVTAGQAYHWFEPAKALPEIARVLRPGGVFCPIWNVRDESRDWVKRMSEIASASDAEILASRLRAEQEPFAPHFNGSELNVVRHEKPMDGPGLVRLVQSRSYYITATPERQREVLDGITGLLNTHPQLAGRETFTMPYCTYVFRSHLAAKTA